MRRAGSGLPITMGLAGGSSREGGGNGGGSSALLAVSLAGNFALLTLLLISTAGNVPYDGSLQTQENLMRREPSSTLDLERVIEQLDRVNKQLKQDAGTLSRARLSLEEAMVIEEMRGLPVDEARKVLDSVQHSLGAIGGDISGDQSPADGGPPPLISPGSNAPNLALPHGEEKRWLTVGIPTVPRQGGVDYLTRTLESLLDELPLEPTDPLYGKVRVVVMNMAEPDGPKHTVFEELKKRFQTLSLGDFHAKKAEIYVQMMDSGHLFKDPTPDAPEPDTNNNPHDVPGRTARKQTRDLLNLMEAAAGESHFFMFMEDDFETCPHAMRYLHYALQRLNSIDKYKSWLALRVSYGMNGIVIRDEDLSRFSVHVKENMSRKPVDLLWQEFALHSTEHTAILTRGRELHIYRYNLLAHIGEVSSFTGRPPRQKWPQCYEYMTRAWSLQENESFQLKCLDSSDFTPCDANPAQRPGAQKSDVSQRWIHAKLARSPLK